MAKLEDLITPSEILEIIRGGMLKSELIKRYRTSEQEVAMMLYPLYRGGELTKEEFNNFFKGVPLFQHETPVPASPETPPAQDPVDKPLDKPVDKPIDKPVDKPVDEPVNKPVEIIRSLQKFISRKTSTNSAQPAENATDDAKEELSVHEIDPIIEEVVPPVPAIDIERLSVTETLQTIVDKLSSIDDRLSDIEKKLGLD